MKKSDHFVKSGQTKFWSIEMRRILSLCLLLPFLFLSACTENETASGSYTVTFNSDGGTNILPRTVEEGNAVTKPNNPAKIDHAFLGWFTETEFVTEYDFNKPVTSNLTLYAKWERLWRITFNSDGGTAFPFQNRHNNGLASEPNDIPVKRNFIFLGWFLGETKYDFNTPVTSDITLLAKWEALVINSNLGGINELSGLTAMEYFTQMGLYLGWNAGNSLDAPGSETAWVPHPLSQELFDSVKALGFNMVRIPVTWHNATSRPIGPAPDYTLNADRLNRVAEVAEMAYNAGLVAIINVHHDTSWLSLQSARDNPERRTQITAQYKRVWEQIAEHFKDYGDWLIFECFNELHSDRNYGHGNIALLEFEILNEWTQVFTDTVRESGGNNTERFLVIKPYYARPHHVIDPVTEEIVDRFNLPNDPTPKKQIVSVHYYDPEPFALNGAGPEWGTDVQKKTISDKFAPFGRVLVRGMGIPVIMGESGAVLQLYPDDPARQALAHANRVAYMAHLCSVARDNGIVPVYWDNGTITATGEKFGLIARDTGAPYSANEAEILQAMYNAVQ